MKYLVETFREFLDLAKINQGPDGWRIYGSNPRTELKRTEKVSFPDLGITKMSAKIDTGADNTAIHANDIKVINGVLTFWIKSKNDKISIKNFTTIEVKNSFGKKEKRYQIKTTVRLDDIEFKTKVSLANRKNMEFPCILGHAFIKQGKFTININ
jgi:hypothetical protein